MKKTEYQIWSSKVTVRLYEENRVLNLIKQSYSSLIWRKQSTKFDQAKLQFTDMKRYFGFLIKCSIRMRQTISIYSSESYILNFHFHVGLCAINNSVHVWISCQRISAGFPSIRNVPFEVIQFSIVEVVCDVRCFGNRVREAAVTLNVGVPKEENKLRVSLLKHAYHSCRTAQLTAVEVHGINCGTLENKWMF